MDDLERRGAPRELRVSSTLTGRQTTLVRSYVATLHSIMVLQEFPQSIRVLY